MIHYSRADFFLALIILLPRIYFIAGTLSVNWVTIFRRRYLVQLLYTEYLSTSIHFFYFGFLLSFDTFSSQGLLNPFGTFTGFGFIHFHNTLCRYGLLSFVWCVCTHWVANVIRRSLHSWVTRICWKSVLLIQVHFLHWGLLAMIDTLLRVG